MKHLFLFLLLPIVGYGQQVDSTISEKTIGPIDCEFVKTTRDGHSDYAVFVSYQNSEYEYITDIGMIMLTDSLQVDTLISDIEGAMLNMKVGKRPTVSYERSHYSLAVYDFSLMMYIYDEDDKKITINKKQAENLVTWLKTIQFP